MISLELAEKLKSAGLAWEPRKALMGDWYYYNGIYSHHNPRMIIKPTDNSELYWNENLKDVYFAPSLSQLLAEIEARGHEWEIGTLNKRYAILMSSEMGYYKDADTPEDAAADALLWILEREGKA